MIYVHQDMTLFDIGDNEHLLLFAQWWKTTKESSEGFEFIPEFNRVSDALGQFHAPNIAFFIRDQNGIRALFWLHPTLGGCVIGLWVRPDQRKSREIYRRFIDFMNYVFFVFPIAYCFIANLRLFSPLKKLGFQLIDNIHTRALFYLLRRDFTKSITPHVVNDCIFISNN